MVVDSTPSASGVSPGMTLEEALSIRSGDSRPRKPTSLTTVGCSLKLSPPCRGSATAWKGPKLGSAYIRLDGLERLYGGEARLVNALLNAVPQDLAPRVGVAEAKFPAFVAADGERAPQGQHGFLSDASGVPRSTYPVDILPVPTDLKVSPAQIRPAYPG